MSTTEETTIVDQLNQLDEEASPPREKVHWSRRRLASHFAAAIGAAIGLLIWLILVSAPFYEWSRSQDGAGAAWWWSGLMMVSIVVLFMALGWLFARHTYNKQRAIADSEEES